MAVGTRTTYSDTNRKARVLSKVLDILGWDDAPILNLLGTDNAKKFGVTPMGTKYEWMTDVRLPMGGSTNAALNDNETRITVVTPQGTYVKVGDLIRIENEVMAVTALVSATQFDVTRGAWSSTAAAHATAVQPWYLVSHAAVEGSDTVTGFTTVIGLKENYVATIREGFKVTGDELVDPKYDGINTKVYHMERLLGAGGKAGKLPQMLEGIFANGYGSAAGSASTARFCAGVPAFVTSHVTALAGAALTRTHIEDALQACYQSGGTPNTLIVPAWPKRKISYFYEKYITTTRSEKRGGSMITNIETDFGSCEVLYWRNCPVDKMYLIDPAEMGWVKFRDWEIQDKPASGDFELYDILGGFGFVVRAEASHAIISGISTNA